MIRRFFGCIAGKVRNVAAAGAGLSAVALAAVALIHPDIVAHEKRVLVTYRDPIGVPTYCSGLTRGAVIGVVYSESQCIRLEQEELLYFAGVIERQVGRELPVETFAALISFVYNIGEGNFATSTARKKMQAGDIAGGCRAIAARSINAAGRCSGYGCGWAGGVMLPGLPPRREWEKTLCLEGLSDVEKPIVALEAAAVDRSGGLFDRLRRWLALA